MIKNEVALFIDNFTQLPQNIIIFQQGFYVRRSSRLPRASARLPIDLVTTLDSIGTSPSLREQAFHLLRTEPHHQIILGPRHRNGK